MQTSSFSHIQKIAHPNEDHRETTAATFKTCEGILYHSTVLTFFAEKSTFIISVRTFPQKPQDRVKQNVDNVNVLNEL